MRLNSKGTLAKFYMWFPPDDKELPQDFCSYFWGLIGRAIFVFGMGGMAASGLIYAIVRAAIFVAYFILAHKSQTLIALGALLLLALMIWLSERKKKIKIGVLSEVKMVIAGKVDAIKNQYCPRIEWTKELNVPERDAETQ